MRFLLLQFICFRSFLKALRAFLQVSLIALGVYIRTGVRVLLQSCLLCLLPALVDGRRLVPVASQP